MKLPDQQQLPYALTIAGFDPCSGAGLTADVKTFEAHGLYGLAVCTAITVQNDSEFESCQWVEQALILSQLEVLFRRYDIAVVKIGLVKSWDSLLGIQQYLQELKPGVKIVLDPVLKASAGFDFREQKQSEALREVLRNCALITPNYEEIFALFPGVALPEIIEILKQLTTLYLKGGHRKEKLGWDEIYTESGALIKIPPGVAQVHQKHGSGCVLSSALAANLALGYEVQEAGERAKRYTERFLNSSTRALGLHDYDEKDTHKITDNDK